jgi:pimeloyl-ACP methyl ester carboxylesterase
MNIYALDLPGHGKSDAQALDSISAYTALLKDWLDAVGLRRVLLVGHSMGSAIAMQMALDWPAGVAGLGLVRQRLPGGQPGNAALQPAGLSNRGSVTPGRQPCAGELNWQQTRQPRVHAGLRSLQRSISALKWGNQSPALVIAEKTTR